MRNGELHYKIVAEFENEEDARKYEPQLIQKYRQKLYW